MEKGSGKPHALGLPVRDNRSGKPAAFVVDLPGRTGAAGYTLLREICQGFQQEQLYALFGLAETRIGAAKQSAS